MNPFEKRADLNELVIEMLCGRSIHGDPHYIPSAEYNGRVIHFCTDFCLNAFKADPERFQSAHGKKPGWEKEGSF